MVLRIATRRSRQARAQATAVAEAIRRATGEPIELVFVDTAGDADKTAPLHTIGGQGVFVKEVQHAVLDGRADIAVHSAKDMPSAPTPGLVIAAFTRRRDPRDALVGRSLDDLPVGATVASGSVRRRAQLGDARPDIIFVELRGNIDTRLAKIPDGGAIVMAAAALEILELSDRVAELLPVEAFVPAVGQGCVAAECRTDDERAAAALGAVDHPGTRRAVTIERAFLAELGSGCSMPVGAHVDDDHLCTYLAGEDGRRAVERIDLAAAGSLAAEVELGRAAARRALGSSR
jgi:hydroxymethylbilane synthase